MKHDGNKERGIMEEEQTIREHLNEIKKRALCILVPAVAMFLIYFSFSSLIITKFLSYYNVQAFILAPLDYINTQIKIAGVLTLITIIPVILTQLYLFAKTAISENYKSRIIRQIVYSSLLAVGGVMFGIFVVVKYALNFLGGMSGLQNLWGISSIFNFMIFSALACGLFFQIIVIIPFLDNIKILNADYIRKKRPMIFFIILILAAWLTPSLDIVNMFIMAVPMYCCMEIGLAITKINAVRNKMEVKNGIWNN